MMLAQKQSTPNMEGDQVVGDSHTKLRISVWRDFTPQKALTLRSLGRDEHQLLSADTELQQEIFTWQMREDPFGGISDDAARAKLRDLLIDRFAGGQSPANRRVDVLRDFLEEVERVIAGGHVEWTQSQDAPDDDEEIPYKINPLLALKLHLEWILDCFSGQPGVSVSIR